MSSTTYSIKLLLKIFVDKEPKWVHLCYIDSELYREFVKITDEHMNLNGFLSNWCNEDFEVKLEMNSPEDLSTLRNLIRDHYKERYPELYRDNRIDRQGWTRVWIANKMRHAIETAS